MPDATKLAGYLRIGDRFYVEPEEGDPIPVELTAPGQWGVVHGEMRLPAMRLDTLEHTIIAIHRDVTVRRVTDAVG